MQSEVVARGELTTNAAELAELVGAFPRVAPVAADDEFCASSTSAPA